MTSPVNNGGLSMIEARMAFSDFGHWLEMQRRLSALAPAVRVDIGSLTKEEARVKISFKSDIGDVSRLMLQKGIVLARPAVEVDPALWRGAALPQSARGELYELRFVQ